METDIGVLEIDENEEVVSIIWCKDEETAIAIAAEANAIKTGKTIWRAAKSKYGIWHSLVPGESLYYNVR